MIGGIEIYEKYLNEKQFRPIAMQVLAAGAIRPKEAIEYLEMFLEIEIASLCLLVMTVW